METRSTDSDESQFVAPVEIEGEKPPIIVEKDKVIIMGVEIPRNPEP